MQLRGSWILITIITLLVNALGNYFVGVGMPWYQTLIYPTLTPPGWVFGIVWTLIYIGTTISAIITWDTAKRTARFRVIMMLFGLNALANLLWTYLFFYHRMMRAALYDIFALIITLVLLILLLFPENKKAAMLLIPY
jgi:tryptophan-rich sensory protein